ncbi:MAG TPA: ABC transporter substrate-binding protein, partial [Chloroflexota bacterium]
MQRSTPMVLLALIGFVLTACAPGTIPSGPSSNSASAPAESNRTLVGAIRTEPDSLAVRPISSGLFASFALSRRMFNADLTLPDAKGNPAPYLAEALPQLNSNTWSVSPDGQMETTWKLKPSLFWHDGTPLTAQDFVFAAQVYRVPEFGAGGSRLIRALGEVVAPDEHTVVMRWKQPYPNADDLTGTDGFPPLPRQILEAPFQQLDSNAFINSAFWTREYVGLGPYRMEAWEPGSFFQGVAFDRHVLGRPKIGRLKVLFITDVNTALANLLAGEVDMVVDNAINLEQAVTLKNDWERRGAGTVLYSSLTWQATAFQLRPELVNPHALLDIRVRRALAHTVNKQALSDSVYGGAIATSEFLASPLSKWGPAIEGSVQKYPYDVRRGDELMNEAGFAKGSDGFFTSSSEGRFRAELKTADSPDWVAEMQIMASDWKKAAFDIQEAVLPAALSIDPASRVTFPGMFTSISGQGEGTLGTVTTAQIPRVENGWRGGSNRGGWSNTEYDRLFDAFTTTLEAKERGAQVAQMAKVFSEDLPLISLLFLAVPYAHVPAL